MTDDTKPANAWIGPLLGWLILALVVTQLYFSTKVATTPLWTPERVELRENHMSIGMTIAILLIARLILWWRSRPTPRPAGLPANAQGLAVTCILALYLTLLGFSITGPLQAWSEGFRVALWGIPVPALAPKSYALNAFAGYLHSAFAFFIWPLALLIILVGIYQSVRYKTRILRLLPGRWT
jgi:cytochrome b561